jgi:ABC-type glycerol-3-phosphate transport system substrate-binding protein
MQDAELNHRDPKGVVYRPNPAVSLGCVAFLCSYFDWEPPKHVFKDAKEHSMSNVSSMSRRQFLRMSGMTAGALVLAACQAVPVSQAPAATTGGEAAAPAAATINMEAWSRMTDVAQESILGIIENYNTSNTIGAQVEHIFIAQTQGSQADEKLLTAVAGGTPPAVYYADRFTVPQFAHQGFFMDITDQATAAGVSGDQYYDFAWQEANYKDRLHALPFDTDTRALWYNKDIVAEAGLDPEAPPQTLDDLKVWASTMTTRGDGNIVSRFGSIPGALPLKGSSRIPKPAALRLLTPTTLPRRSMSRRGWMKLAWPT